MGMGALFGWLVLPLVTLAQTTGSNTQVRLSVPIGSMSSVAAEGGLAQYIVGVYGYMLGIVTIVAVIMVMYGGFRYLLGSTYGDVKTGKDIILDALGGMAVLFLAYFILYNVNPKTVTLQVPGLTRIRSVALSQPAAPIASPGQSCMKDADCRDGGKCLRTSGSGGLCARGEQGGICKCRGAGCGVSAEQAGGPVNNAGRGEVDCQTGLRCTQIANNEYICNGGAFAACNESSDYFFRVDNVQAAQNAATVVGRSVESIVAFSTLGQVGDVSNPFSRLPDSVQRQIREAERCSRPGQYCFQPTASQAGACVYGDQRDAAIFDGIPTYRQNRGLQESVERCDLTPEQLRQIPKASGGCRNITNNNVDEFCVAHRYRCANQAVCTRSEYADAFASTLAQYHSWENVPQQLRPEYFLHQGCKKPANATCTADAECSTKCVQGRCTGVGLVVIKDGIAPGTIRGLPRADQVEGIAAPPQSCDSSWTWVQLLSQTGIPVADRQAVLDRLFSAGTADRFACYPKRSPNEACDFNEQCRSGACTIPAGVTRPGTPASYAAPTDAQAGVGRCT